MLSDEMERIARTIMTLIVRGVCIVAVFVFGLWLLVAGLRMVGADI